MFIIGLKNIESKKIFKDSIIFLYKGAILRIIEKAFMYELPENQEEFFINFILHF